MRSPSHALILAGLAATGLASCSHSVSPGSTPSLDSDTGIVVLVVDTDTPLRDIFFNEVDQFDGFTLGFADRGRSVHLFKVPAERYRLSSFDSGDEDVLDPKAGGDLCIMVKPGQMNYPGHFVYRGAEQKRGYKTYANVKWQDDLEDMKRRVTIEWTDLLASYPVERTECP